MDVSPLPLDDLDVWADGARRRLAVRLAGNIPRDADEAADTLVRSALTDGILTAGHEVWRVGESAGTVWLADRGTEASVMDLHVGANADPVEVLRAVRGTAHSRWKHLLISHFRGDSVAAQAVQGATLVAAKMSVAVCKSAAPGIDLRPMTQQRFEQFIGEGIERYAQSLFAAGGYSSIDAARSHSVRQHEQLLPDGLQSDGHVLWSAFDPAHPTEEVGILWVEEREGYGFIYDIAVDPAHQRKGWGTRMLRVAASEMFRTGRDSLWLNVFGHNDDARRLYEREGYVVREEIYRIEATESA